MAFFSAFILTVALFPFLCNARESDDNLIFCKPRSILIRFRVEKQFPIHAYRSCPTEDGGSSNCGGPFGDIVKVRCQDKKCPPGVRCKNCRARLLPRMFPRYYTTRSGKPVLGRYLFQFADGGGSCIFLEFDSDFENSGPEWFARHNYVAGCKDRVTCLNRRRDCVFKDPPFDLSMSAQACDAQLFDKAELLSTALTFGKCLGGDFTPPTNGPPPGEVIGTDCGARLL